MKAYVMITVRSGAILEVVNNLRHIEEVMDANMTFGPYDVVAVIQAENVHRIGRLIAADIQPIPGVIDTLTCLILEP